MRDNAIHRAITASFHLLPDDALASLNEGGLLYARSDCSLAERESENNPEIKQALEILFAHAENFSAELPRRIESGFISCCIRLRNEALQRDSKHHLSPDSERYFEISQTISRAAKALSLLGQLIKNERLSHTASNRLKAVYVLHSRTLAACTSELYEMIESSGFSNSNCTRTPLGQPRYRPDSSVSFLRHTLLSSYPFRIKNVWRLRNKKVLASWLSSVKAVIEIEHPLGSPLCFTDTDLSDAAESIIGSIFSEDNSSDVAVNSSGRQFLEAGESVMTAAEAIRTVHTLVETRVCPPSDFRALTDSQSLLFDEIFIFGEKCLSLASASIKEQQTRASSPTVNEEPTA